MSGRTREQSNKFVVMNFGRKLHYFISFRPKYYAYRQDFYLVKREFDIIRKNLIESVKIAHRIFSIKEHKNKMKKSLFTME